MRELFLYKHQLNRNLALVIGLLYVGVAYQDYMMEQLETYDELNDIPFSNIKNLVLDLNTFHVM